MIFNKNLKNYITSNFTTLILSACSTAKKSGTLMAMFTLEKKQLNT